MLPPLHALSLDAAVAARRASATGAPGDEDAPGDANGPPVAPAGLTDLPPDLLEALLGILDAEHPCREVVKLCGLNRKWRGWCRDGWLYDAANRALGFYGQFESWEAVLAMYAAIRVTPPGATPEAYFKAACLARFGEHLAGVPQHHPFYEARLLHQVRTTGLPKIDHIPTHLSNYGAFLRRAVQKEEASALKFVPKDRADYGEIAKLALQTKGWALEFVPTDRADYGELAMLAVAQDGWSEIVDEYYMSRRFRHALKFVPTDRADYGELATVAVQADGRALRFVPRTRDDYGELARLAVVQWPEVFRFVPVDRADYAEIVKLAFRSLPNPGYGYQPRALNMFKLVDRDHPEFVDIAVLAAQLSHDVIKMLRSNDEFYDYDEIVKRAISKNPYVIEDMEGDRITTELIRMALKQQGLLLGSFPALAKDTKYEAYNELVRIAVAQNGYALRYVPKDRADYGALARIAVAQDWHALEYVPKDRADYGELARIAVAQNGRAIEFVPKNRADYSELFWLSKKAPRPPSPPPRESQYIEPDEGWFS